MTRITTDQTLERVEYIEATGSGTLHFAVEDESGYLTWDGVEDAEWTVKGVDYAENAAEDRIRLYPDGTYFICEIEAETEEWNRGKVHCRG